MEAFVSIFTGMTVSLAKDCQVDQQIRLRGRDWKNKLYLIT